MIDSISLIFCRYRCSLRRVCSPMSKSFEAVAAERKETCEKKMIRGRERMAKGGF